MCLIYLLATLTVALFYFAGHGSLDMTGGFLCGSDSQRDDDGLSLSDVIALAHSIQSTQQSRRAR